MTKLTKISGISAAFILIALDVLAIINSFALGGASVFNNFINYSIPCGLLLGCVLLAAIYEKPYKKSLSITTMVFFSILLLIRTLAIVLRILELIYATNIVTVWYTQYMELAQYSAFTVLALAVIFLLIYLTKGKLEKTALFLGGFSCLGLLGVWAVHLYTLITGATQLSISFLQFLIELYNSGFFRDMLVALAYIIAFWTINEINKEKEKA